DAAQALRAADDHAAQVELVRRFRFVLGIEAHDALRFVHGKHDEAAENFALHGMKPELERRDDAEVAAAAAHAPIELRVLLGVCVQELAVRRDDVYAEHVVEREAEAPPDAAEATAEREAA